LKHKESVADFVAAPQEPTIEVVTVTQKPVTPPDTPMTDQQPEPTMASLSYKRMSSKIITGSLQARYGNGKVSL